LDGFSVLTNVTLRRLALQRTLKILAASAIQKKDKAIRAPFKAASGCKRKRRAGNALRNLANLLFVSNSLKRKSMVDIF
jgi:hypothetical protein